MLALEALSPNARAVVVLRDVFDCDVDETAAALELSPANVRVLRHRARRAMEGYDRDREAPPSAATQELFGRFLVALRAGDAAAVRALLSDDVVSATAKLAHLAF